VAKEIDGDSFERLFNTDQKVDIRALAQAYGWTYAKCTNLNELAKAWELTGAVLIDYELVD
jgi:2-succinyl-5-enolpyruvyl-6-hydroxy-3-cyclohexene-1-carboxylate synthase